VRHANARSVVLRLRLRRPLCPAALRQRTGPRKRSGEGNSGSGTARGGGEMEESGEDWRSIRVIGVVKPRSG